MIDPILHCISFPIQIAKFKCIAIHEAQLLPHININSWPTWIAFNTSGINIVQLTWVIIILLRTFPQRCSTDYSSGIRFLIFDGYIIHSIPQPNDCVRRVASKLCWNCAKTASDPMQLHAKRALSLESRKIYIKRTEIWNLNISDVKISRTILINISYPLESVRPS